MVTRRLMLLGGASIAALAALRWSQAPGEADAGTSPDGRSASFEIQKPDSEWRRVLTPAQYQVLRQHGTERPNSSPLNAEKRNGTFACAGCELPLFSSATKYDSRTGWPSFWQPLPDAVVTAIDRSDSMVRIEVLCRRCGGHLGHVFKDGPKPTGLRYCMNGLALGFVPTAA